MAESDSDPAPLAQTLEIDRKEQDAAHYGRGGAGNTYNPNALAQTGSFNMVERQAQDVPTGSTEGSESGKGIGMRGRGGAGNYAYTGDRVEESREPLTGASMSDDVKGLVEQDDEKRLTRPGKAYLGGRERQAKKTDDSALEGGLTET